MEKSQQLAGFSKTDRLGLTVFSSILVHMVIIMGITFTAPILLRDLQKLPSITIELVNSPALTDAPDEADFLAQSNQDGGGDSEKSEIAKSLLTATPSPKPNADMPQAAEFRREMNLVDRIETDLITESEPQEKILDKPEPVPEASIPQLKDPRAGIEQTSAYTDQSKLIAMWNFQLQQYQKRPQRKYISARTKESNYAFYLDAWRRRIEKIGNLNYPDEAKHKKIYGSLVLQVAIKANGQVEEVIIQRSSGKKILDDAAVRIVKLAAPFPPLPAEILKDTDILHITRTWEFTQTDTIISF